MKHILLTWWLLAACAVAITLIFCVALANADLANCIDATCRIRTPMAGGKFGSGTGCVFEVGSGYVYVITAAHVIEGSNTAVCEFWQCGHQSAPLQATVIGRTAALDTAILSVPVSAFGGRVPKPIPILERGQQLAVGQTIMSVGCASGAWPTAWRGHVVQNTSKELIFVPAPANGRSGSALFDESGTRIVGVLQARNDAAGQGIGTSAAALYAFFGRQQSAAKAGVIISDDLVPVQCGPGGCGPGILQPRGGYGGGGYIQGPRGGMIGGGGGADGNYRGGPWPTPPGIGGGGGADGNYRGGPWPTLPGIGGEQTPTPAPIFTAPSLDTAAEQFHSKYWLPFRNDVQRQQSEIQRQQAETQQQLTQIQQQLSQIQQQQQQSSRPLQPIPQSPITPVAPQPKVDENPDAPKTLPGRIAQREAEWLAEHGGPISSRLAAKAEENLESDSAAVRFKGFTQAKVALLIFCTAIFLAFCLGLFLLHKLNNRLIPKLQAAAAATPNTIDDKLVGILASLHDRVGMIDDKVKSHLPDMAALRAKADAALHVGTAAALAAPAGPAASAAAAAALASGAILQATPPR